MELAVTDLLERTSGIDMSQYIQVGFVLSVTCFDDIHCGRYKRKETINDTIRHHLGNMHRPKDACGPCEDTNKKVKYVIK